MLRYDTGVQYKKPITPAMQGEALAGLAAQGSAMQYPGSAGDVYNARSMALGMDYERQAAEANNEYTAAAQRAQQSTALSGLQQMAQAQQNSSSLADKQQSMKLDYLGRVSGGLNSLLGNIF